MQKFSYILQEDFQQCVEESQQCPDNLYCKQKNAFQGRPQRKNRQKIQPPNKNPQYLVQCNYLLEKRKVYEVFAMKGKMHGHEEILSWYGSIWTRGKMIGFIPLGRRKRNSRRTSTALHCPSLIFRPDVSARFRNADGCSTASNENSRISDNACSPCAQATAWKYI